MSLDTFIRLADSLIEFEIDLIENRYPIDSIHAVEVHNSELKTTWDKIKCAYEKYLLEQNEKKKRSDDVGASLESFKVKYKSTYITYCNCLTKLGEISDSLRNDSLSTIESPKAYSATVAPPPFETHSVHLPPCDLEVFRGDYMLWPTFRDMFTAMYIRNTKLSSVEKLFHLNLKTAGEAREIVKKSPLTNQGFDLAWSSLSERFENRRILVNGQLKLLFNLSAINTESGKAIKQLQRDINSCIRNLQLYDIDVQSWDPMFVFICSRKLPESTLTLWEQGLENKTDIPKWVDLDLFLINRYRTLESVTEMRNSSTAGAIDLKPKNSNNHPRKINTYQNQVNSPSCQLCPKEAHLIRKCPKFLQMAHSQRLHEIKKQGLCLNCFSKTHAVKNCSSKVNCYKCNKRHHTLLHAVSEALTAQKSNSSTNSQLNPHSASFSSRSIPTGLPSTSNLGADGVQSFFSTSPRGVLLGTALVDICNCGIRYKARALIDSGSEATFISERLFHLLGLPHNKTRARVSGLNNSVSAHVQKQCTLIVGSPLDSKLELSVNALVVPHLSGNLPSARLDSCSFTNIPITPLADSQFYKGSKIDLLIGGDLFPSIMLNGVKHNVCGSLMGQETIFGWILTGPTSNGRRTPASTLVSYFSEVSLDKQISSFWEVENLPRNHYISSSDKFCEDLFAKSTKRNRDGRYIVSLPFKEGYPNQLQLGQSRIRAMAQFYRNEARLVRNPNFKEEYDGVVTEYEELGQMIKVSAPISSKSVEHFYLPHHAVIKPDSTTTKVRVVFNASSASSNGLSLNDILYPGPTLQSDLTLLILKWRFFKYVFNADIQKMYRQIQVDPSHTPFQRILFRKVQTDIIQDYELKTVTFGVNCAPYLAIRTILQLAEDVQSIYPQASSILRNSMYVDDVLAGAHTISEAYKCKTELILALQSACFSLRKWTANSKEILSDLPPEHLLSQDFLDFEDSSRAKTLGIRWNAKTDSFYFTATSMQEKLNSTKREVLSQIAKLFDPAGWLAPCIVMAKIIMQKILIDGTGWDDFLTADSLSQWKTFQSNYPYINEIEIPRWINYSPYSEVQFHGFCDASERAYAAVLYIRIVQGATISTSLICSKTKVAPVKTLSIPRLELCAAALLADMLDSFLPKLEVKQYSIFCWTDSSIVLSWLAKPPCSWLTFVANRVSKIIQITDQSIWRHVASESNPADLASRGLYPQQLIRNDLWWYGPAWLHDTQDKWLNSKNQIIHQETDMEKKPIKVHLSYFYQHDDILERFSSFSKAMRVVAYIYRFFFRTHPSSRASFYKESTVVSSSEILFVRNKLISVCQKVHFPDEYRSLSSLQALSASSSLLNLNPFIDSEGIIRSCGRLESSADLRYSERHPVIVPYNCQFTRLLVKFIHVITLHGGNQLVLRLIRTEYWIPRVKNLIKATINKCKPCIIYKKKCQRQLMGQLPPERLEISRPFTHTGLDFAGPFDIKTYHGRSCKIYKGYVCVFVCFSTKAIHLEATTDLTTAAFLAAFSRFVSRRGCPLHLHSDNGKTFVGASRILAKDFVQTSSQAVIANYALQNISWHFIPPGAPHMGGLWEAGVKSFKFHFRRFAGSFKFTFEEFSTLLSRIEACLNSRPLSAISQDPSDLSALTPGHFLIGSPIMVPIDPQINETPTCIVNRWQRLKIIYKNFCFRWKNEYLKELLKRVKWKRAEENLEENALVVIREENLPPNSWRLGRVQKVYLGNDQRARVADIRTQRGIITRPITKLIPLPSDS